MDSLRAVNPPGCSTDNSVQIHYHEDHRATIRNIVTVTERLRHSPIPHPRPTIPIARTPQEILAGDPIADAYD